MPKVKNKIITSETQNNSLLVWTGVTSEQSKSQKEFNDILKKHKEAVSRAKELDSFFKITNSVYLSDVLPEIEKQKNLERKRFSVMCEILFEEKISFSKQQREALRNYLLEICYDHYLEDKKFYEFYLENLETKSERTKRLLAKMSVEKKIKSQFGLDIDLDELNQTKFDSEEERVEHEEKFKEFREKYESYRAEYFKHKSQKKSEKKKSKAQLEKEKKQLEAEKLLSLDINSLFKSLAKLIHPDKEQNPVLREKKSSLMTELSRARDNMNIAEILEIKFKVDELIPDEQTDVSFNDISIKRFIVIIKSKIKELENSIKERLYSHPLLQDYPDKKIDVKKLEKFLSAIKKNNQRLTKSFQDELRSLEQNPVYIKEILRDLSRVGY
ncbi:hypothetical protein P3G55_10630 [Leptospira sp. 96542]|nr:hypothetical protein [Leptospira sp. 96542]